MLIHQVEDLRSRWRNHRPERHPRGCARRNSYAAAKTENGIEGQYQSYWRAAARRSPRPACGWRVRAQKPRARSVSNCKPLADSPSTTAICAAQMCGRLKSAAAAWPEERQPRPRTRSARTSWKTPDERRRRCLAPARVRHTRSARSRGRGCRDSRSKRGAPRRHLRARRPPRASF